MKKKNDLFSLPHLNLLIAALLTLTPKISEAAEAETNRYIQAEGSLGESILPNAQKNPVPTIQGKLSFTDYQKGISLMEVEKKSRVGTSGEVSLNSISLHLNRDMLEKDGVSEKLGFFRVHHQKNILLGAESKDMSILYLQVGLEPKAHESGAIMDTAVEVGTTGTLQLREEEKVLHSSSIMGLDRMIIGGQIANPKGEDAKFQALRLAGGTRNMAIQEKVRCLDSQGRELYDLVYNQYDLFAQLEARFNKGLYAQAEVGTEVRVLSNSPGRDSPPPTGSRSAPYVGLSAGIRY